MHLQAWYGFVELLVCNNWILRKHAVSSICIAPPQLNSIGAPTRVIGNTTVYNGKRVFATNLAFVFEATRVPGWWINALGNSLTSEPAKYRVGISYRSSLAVEPRHRSSSAVEPRRPIGRRTLIKYQTRPSGSSLIMATQLSTIWDPSYVNTLTAITSSYYFGTAIPEQAHPWT